MYKTLHKKQGSVTVQLRFARSSVTFCAKRDNSWLGSYEITEDNIHAILQKEIGKVFVQVLECAGVYKNTKKGRIDFGRFIETL